MLHQRACGTVAVEDVAQGHGLICVERQGLNARVHLAREHTGRDGVAVVVGEQVGERAAVGDDDALLVRIVAQGLLAVVEGVVGALLEGVARVVRKVFCRDDIAAGQRVV